MDITALTQLWVRHFLNHGDLAIDATVGNGHDTVFLARTVGPKGKVLGFDIQEMALCAASENLAGREEGLLGRVTLLKRSHTEMEAALVKVKDDRRPKAIMFNLGYLPGGDKALTTQADETVRALRSALDLLGAPGILTIVLYPGHPEGQKESQVILEWAGQLTGSFEVIISRPLNRANTAPFLVAVEKRA